ncbi:MAG: hypothetical protein ACRCSI_00015 [Eubacterium aggregans]
MNVKKMAKGITVIALLAIIAVGATLAYLSTTTDKLENKFTSTSNIKGKLTETNWDKNAAEKYTPGQVLEKNPVVDLTASNEPAYVAMALDFKGLNTTMSQTEFAQYCTINDLNTTDWELIAKSANGSELYAYKSIVAAGASTNAIFQNITVNAGLKTYTATQLVTTKTYTYEDLNSNGKFDADTETKTEVDSSSISTNIAKTDYIDALGNTIAIDHLPAFQIDAQGFAVQSTDTASVYEAELIKLANAERTGNDLFVVL